MSFLSLSLSHCVPEEAVTVRLVLTALLQDSILLSSPAFYTGGAAIQVFSTLYIVNPSISRYQHSTVYLMNAGSNGNPTRKQF